MVCEMRVVRRLPAAWKALLIPGGMAVSVLLLVSGSCAMRLLAQFTPRRIEALAPIEQRTGWIFPPETRIITAARGRLGMDVGIWAVLEVPREDVPDLLLSPQTGQFASVEGENGFPEVCRHMSGTYWIAAPDWIPPLPREFKHYVGVSRFEPSSYDVREAIAEMADEESAMATVYVMYATY